MICKGTLWLAALAVFLLVNPVVGLDGRTWQEAVTIYGGVAAVGVAAAGASPLSILFIYVIAQAAVRPSGGALATLLLLAATAGLFALAAHAGARRLLMAIAAANVMAMALQYAGLWLPILRAVSSGATVEVYNALHPASGLTSSTGDLAVVLAMALPFFFAGSPGLAWLAGAGVIAGLLATSALSGIVAGAVGVLVACWPRLTAWGRRLGDYALAVPIGLALLAGLYAERPGAWSEVTAAVTDERWRVWWLALKRAAVEAPIFGHGLGAWASANMTVLDHATHQARVWSDLHFDLLQFAYDVGVVGALLAVLSWGWLARRAEADNRPALGGLAALAVCQFGHFPFHLGAGLTVAALVAGEAIHGEAA